MRELFDVRFNPNDKPMTQSQLADAVKTADVLVPTVTDRIDTAVLSKSGEQLKLIANFGNGVDNIDVATAVSARHHRHQYAGRADRGYRRHDHGADPGGAAAAGRRLRRADADQDWPRLDADLDAGPPHLGQASWHHRHGADRPGRGAPRPRLRPANPLHNRRKVAPKIEEELDATYWESLDQMLARMDIVSVNCPHTPATYHLLSARRLKLLRPEAYIVNTSRGEVIDENALARLIEAGDIAGAGLDVFEHEPAVNPKLVKLARAGKVVLLPQWARRRRRPRRHGREGHHQHQDIHGRASATGSRAAEDVVISTCPEAQRGTIRVQRSQLPRDGNQYLPDKSLIVGLSPHSGLAGSQVVGRASRSASNARPPSSSRPTRPSPKPTISRITSSAIIEPSNAGQRAENAGFRASRHRAGRRRLWKQTAIRRIAPAVGTLLMRANGGERAVEGADRGGDQRLLCKITGVRHEIARGEIIRAVGDDVVLSKSDRARCRRRAASCASRSATCGLSRAIAASALSTLRMPISSVPKITWRCKFDSDTVSSSTTPRCRRRRRRDITAPAHRDRRRRSPARARLSAWPGRARRPRAAQCGAHNVPVLWRPAWLNPMHLLPFRPAPGVLRLCLDGLRWPQNKIRVALSDALGTFLVALVFCLGAASAPAQESPGIIPVPKAETKPVKHVKPKAAAVKPARPSPQKPNVPKQSRPKQDNRAQSHANRQPLPASRAWSTPPLHRRKPPLNPNRQNRSYSRYLRRHPTGRARENPGGVAVVRRLYRRCDGRRPDAHRHQEFPEAPQGQSHRHTHR